MRDKNNNYKTLMGKDLFNDHWIITNADNPDEFVSWLMNESGYSTIDVIDELEYQCSNPDAISHYSIFSDALNNIPVACSQCGKSIHYGDANWITQYKTDTHSEVISRSLVGGSTVRRKSTITYATGRLCYCNECYNEYKRVAKENSERHSIKGFFKKLFK